MGLCSNMGDVRVSEHNTGNTGQYTVDKFKLCWITNVYLKEA